MAKIIYNDIPNIETPWENYAGSSVEKFIKSQLNNKCGYIYRSPNKEGDYYYLYGFTDYDQYEAWISGAATVVPLFKVQLPNVENDTFSVNLTTNSNTQKLVNLGDGVRINLKYTSIATNPVTGTITDTYNDGTLIISRSANGSAYEEVGRIIIQPTPYDSVEFKQYDITRFLADGDNKIRLRVEDNINGSTSSNITFQSIINTTLRIENATSTSQPLTALQLQYYIEGQVTKTLHIKVSQNGNTSNFEYPIGTNTYIEVPYTTPLMSMSLEAGTVNVDAWLSVDDTELVSYHEINQFYYSDGTDTDTVIILNNVADEIINYTNTHLFDLSLYNQNADVDIYIRSTDAQTEYLHLTMNNCEVGTLYPVYATLEVEHPADTFNAIVSVVSSNFNCEPYVVTVDNSEKMSPTVGADFVLNPKVRNNSEANPGRIINAVNGSVVASTFTGFGFINDGWVSDENGIQVLRIPAEHSLNIQYDVLNNLTNGTTFELDYKTFNVFNDNDVILSIYSETGDNKPLGFVMNPTECAFYTVQNQTKRDQDVIFQEEERTHLAINIIPNLANSGLNYIRFFVNGVMNREIQYSDTDIFKNGTLSINIGSNNADIDIYGIRVYKKGLSATDVRQDYMSSIPTIEEKKAFKAENDILSSNGTISYDKAKVKYNTLVWTGRVPSKLTGNVQFEGNLHIDILGDDVHSGDITNLIIKGQGSSSRGYWKWNHQYDMDKLDNPSVFTNKNGDTFSGYALTDDDPEAKKLVAKLNWASSMQSHKIGSTALYTDFWKEIVGGNSITATEGFEKARVSVHEKPFLYFVKETDSSQPVFYGLMTFGSAKYDKPTFGYNKQVFPDYLILEGSDNGVPLTLRQVPWLDDEVTYDSGEEAYMYAGQPNLDYGMGNQNMLHYFKDAFNFSYLHSPRLKPYTNDSELTDASYQYWNTTTKNVKRYDWISESWVDAGLTKTTACEYHAATQEDVDNHLADKVGEKVVDVYPVYEAFNLETQTGLLRTNYSSDVEYNAAVISWRVNDFKNRISTYYNVNDVLYSMAILKMVAASDNWCKNTYEYTDPVTHKICLAQDDMDTLFLTDNVGRKTKPYYVEEHDIDGENKPFFNGSDNNFFCLMEKAFEAEEKNMMRQIFNTMRSKFETPQNCIQHYFFDVQEYFPAVAYNETARLLYEEASVAEAEGRYDNATPPITQSLGDQLQAERQWWKRRFPYMQSWSSADPFYVRSSVEPNIMFRSMTTVAGNNPTYQFTLTPWQWLYPKAGTGQYLSTDAQRVPALTQYTTVTLATDGNTDTYIYGSDYYTSFGEFGGVSLSEAFRLNGKRLLEFSADSRNVASYEFRPRSMTVNCPALRSLSLYGCSTLGGVLDLSGCKKLVSVDLRGTNLSSVILPETETLTTVYLPDLASITIVNCPNITTFSISGYTNLLSITTDNAELADDVISNAESLNNVTLYNVDITTTASNVDDYIGILTDENVICNITGSIFLNTELTNSQVSAIESKFGESVWDSSSAFYITYIQTDITSLNLQFEGNEYGSLFNNDSITINVVTNGNNIQSYSWTLTNTIPLTAIQKKGKLIINTTTFDKFEEFSVTYSLTTTNGQTFTKSVNITACYLDFTLNNNVLRNSIIDVIASNVAGYGWAFIHWTLNENISYSGTIETDALNSPGLTEFGEAYGQGYNTMSANNNTGVDRNILSVYGKFIVDSTYNVYVPFKVRENIIPITINNINTVVCENGFGSVHVSWNFPQEYIQYLSVDGSWITVKNASSKYSYGNINKTGCDITFKNITSDIPNAQVVLNGVLYDDGSYSTTYVASSNSFLLDYVKLAGTAEITYNITSTGTAYVLSTRCDISKIAKMYAENGEVTPSQTYDFTTTGTKKVKITAVDGYNFDQLLYGLLNVVSVKFSTPVLGTSVCYSCSNLTSVTFNGSLSSIGTSAFYNCSGLTDIYIEETAVVPTIASNTFQGVKIGGTVHYPESLNFNTWFNRGQYYLGYYKWNEVDVVDGVFKYTITPLGICYIAKNPDNLPSGNITLPATYTYNGKTYSCNLTNYSFNNCTNITSLVIAQGYTNIPYYCFANCKNMQSIVIPSTVSYIYGDRYDNAAFRNCEKLSSITIKRSTAPNLDQFSWGGGSSSGGYTDCAGSKSGTTNILYVPQNATGYDTSEWTAYLLNQTEGYGKFTLSKTL